MTRQRPARCGLRTAARPRASRRPRTQRVDIRAAIDTAVATGLLRAHVGRGTDRHSGRGQFLTSGLGARARATPKSATTAWVPARRMLAGLMSRCTIRGGVHSERMRDLAGDPDRVRFRQLPLSLQPLAEGLPLHIGHRVVEHARRSPRIVQGRCAGAAGGRRSGSRAGSARYPARRRSRPEDLEATGACRSRVARHHRHAPAAHSRTGS